MSATSFIGLGAQLANSKNAEPVEASSSVSNTAYLELNSNIWGSAAAYYTIHYWGGDSSSSWPGANFNNNESASGNAVIKATWDPSSSHVMIVRWSDANHTSEWNRWEYFNTNIITPYSANFFSNDSWGNCESSLVYENSENIYFGNSSSWLNVYAYAFHSSHPGEMGLGVWPGTLISDLSSDITFDNCSGLYRLAINQLIDDTIIFNSGSGSQTANLSIVGDNIYYKADYVTTGDTERGTAADFVYNLNNTRLVISASGDIKEDSICGISSTDATSICQNYNSLSSTIKGYISSSTIYTYTDQSSITADDNIPVSSIMSQLSFISGVTLTSRLILSNSLSNNFSVLIAGIICTVGALTLSSFYLLKKKKSN